MGPGAGLARSLRGSLVEKPMHRAPPSLHPVEVEQAPPRFVFEPRATAAPRLLALDDLGLLEQVIQGDPAAWSAFHRRFHGLVFACCARASLGLRVHLDSDELADLVQETFLRMVSRDYRRLRSYRPEMRTSLGSWLGIIAYSTTKDHVRRRARRVHTWADPGELDGLPSAAEGPDERLERLDRLRLLESALTQLTTRDRELIRLLFVEQLSTPEIAREMGISASTVHSKRSKLSVKLAHRLRTAE